MGAYYQTSNRFPSVPVQQSGPYRPWPGQNTLPPRTASENSTGTQGSDGNRYSYDYGAERMRENLDPSSIGLTEARRLHRQVYYNMSLGDLNRLSPAELGHAAAYQAYVKLSDDPPVSRNFEYERETLIGLAVSEASRLAQQGGRDQEIYNCTAASEAAARTASRIFTEVNGDRVGSSSYRPDSYSEPYDWEDSEPGYPRRSNFRSRQPAFMDTPTVIPEPNMGFGSNRFAPSSLPSEDPFGRTDFPSTGPRYPPTPYPNTTYPPGTVVLSNPGATATNHLYQYPQSDNGALVPAHRPRSASFSYPQQYPSQPMATSYANMPYSYPQGVQPGQTIVIKPAKKHRHRHRHRNRSRSR